MSAPKQTDPAEKQKRLDSAVEAYQKAVDLKKAHSRQRPRTQAKNLAAYYNNLADAYYKAKKVDEAVKTYELAAQTDPAAGGAVLFQYRGGATPMPARPDEANAAFDKCLAADPNRAEAYYQKGLNCWAKPRCRAIKPSLLRERRKPSRNIWNFHPTGPNAEAPRPCWPALGLRWKPAIGRRRSLPKN